MSDEAAWDLVHRGEPPLPLWARTLFESLPRTTALQLDLDALHRARNPLGPVLGAQLRWVVADANRCAYGKAIAEADLTRAGVVDLEGGAGEDWQAAVGAADRVALDFARALTLTAASITDEDVARLIEVQGADDAVAIVHTVAYANFQDRVFLALGLTSEPGGPMPALEIRPTAETEFATPSRPDLVEPVDPGPGVEAGAGWKELSFGHLQDQLERQKRRSARIPDLDAARLARLPRPARERVAGSAWGRVSMGYQPVLTTAWFETMRAFEAEARMDEVFASSVFWVVTRTSQCFY